MISAQLSQEEHAHPTSVVASSSTWMESDGIDSEGAIGNEHIPVCEHPTDQTCRSLDSLLCRRLFVKSRFSRHLLFQ